MLCFFTRKQKDLEVVTLSKWSQTQKNEYCMVLQKQNLDFFKKMDIKVEKRDENKRESNAT